MWGGAPFQAPCAFVLESCLRIVFSQEWGLGAKGGGRGMPVQCASRFEDDGG